MNYKTWLLDLFPFSAYGKENQYLAALKNAKKAPGFLVTHHEPCWRCKSLGEVSVAFGPYDYSEETCTLCKGSKYLSKDWCKTNFQASLRRIKEKRAAQKIVTKELKRIKSKLTKKELAFLLKHN